MSGDQYTRISDGVEGRSWSKDMGEHERLGRPLKRRAIYTKPAGVLPRSALEPSAIYASRGTDAATDGHGIVSGSRDSAKVLSTGAGSEEHLPPRARMQTGCIPCLIKGVACDPCNPDCKIAMSADWVVNGLDAQREGSTSSLNSGHSPWEPTTSLTTIRPDVAWRRGWRERHSLNFFVNFSAPQMAGFFDSRFWSRMVVQASYNEPAILHAIIAIGSLHESILQGAFAEERRKAEAVDYALRQCNRSIGFLTGIEMADDGGCREGSMDPSKLALVTCVLFTCFESMQGHCDSALNHAMQGKLLLQASSKASSSIFPTKDEDDIEDMRALVERLDVQATALVGKKQRPEIDNTGKIPHLPIVDIIYSLEHAHATLHAAMNSTMRFMQSFHPTAPRDHIAMSMAEKSLRYSPWYQQWEAAFSIWLANNRQTLSNMDVKRAMVLKANHLVGAMLSSVDQSAGTTAYDKYEEEFRAIVNLSREVLAEFSCPPLPTLKAGNAGVPYLSFSLWVTDPLWMAISRCRNPTIRQAAFTLLRQNPRQEGIWHAGPQTPTQYMRRVEAGATSSLPGTVKSVSPSTIDDTPTSASTSSCSGTQSTITVVPKDIEEAEEAGSMRARSEWVDLSVDVEGETQIEEATESRYFASLNCKLAEEHDSSSVTEHG